MKLSHKYFKYESSNLPDEFKNRDIHDSLVDVIHFIEETVTYEKKSVEFVQLIVDPRIQPYFILRTTKID